MKCALCGHKVAGKGKYCSSACRQAAYRRRKKGDSKPARKRRPSRNAQPAAPKREPVIDRETFESMMDGDLKDILRANRDRLRKALDDPDTRTADLPALSRQLISVCEKLDNMSGDTGLFDSEDESMEVTEDVGASIV